MAKAIRVNIGVGRNVTFREGEKGVINIFESEDDNPVNCFPYVHVVLESKFNPEYRQPDAPDYNPENEWSEPQFRFSKCLVEYI